MPKYYISSGTFQTIYSTNKNPGKACIDMISEISEYDKLDKYFYVNEKGFRTYETRDDDTHVADLSIILARSGLIEE